MTKEQTLVEKLRDATKVTCGWNGEDIIDQLLLDAADEIEYLAKYQPYARHKEDCGLTLSMPSEEGTCAVIAPCTCGFCDVMDEWRKRYLDHIFDEWLSSEPLAEPSSPLSK